jgi:hypothetical protein
MIVSTARIAVIGLVLAVLGNIPRLHAQQPLIDEIVRKAEAGASEDGFCSRTGWPAGSNFEGYLAHLKAAKAGTWKVSTFENGSCQLDRVTRVRRENGRKCVEYSRWTCSRPQNKCGKGNTVDCIAPDGKSVQRKTS